MLKIVNEEVNKLRKWKRLSQTFGKLFSKFWSKLPSSSAAGNLRERFLERNSSSIVSRNFCWNFLDVRQQVSVGLSKLRFSCPEENREGCFRSKTLFLEIPKCEQLFFQYFCYSFSAVCQNCWILAAQTKTSLQKTFFLEKVIFFQIIFNFRAKFSGFWNNFFHQVCQTCLL